MDESPLVAHRRQARVVRARRRRGSSRAARPTRSSAPGTPARPTLSRSAEFGVMPGVDRPALAVTVPTRTGAAILLDAGANLDCRADHLCQFGVLGAAYARILLHVERPKVGLLSIGEEAGKGTDLVREAHALLERAPIDFLGNLEAREFFSGRADVIVCDGFTGNIALKVGEGLVEAGEEMLREEMGSQLVSQIGALLTRGAFLRFKQRVDYAESGGALLVGLNEVAVVGTRSFDAAGHRRTESRWRRDWPSRASSPGSARPCPRRHRAVRLDSHGAFSPPKVANVLRRVLK